MEGRVPHISFKRLILCNGQMGYQAKIQKELFGLWLVVFSFRVAIFFLQDLRDPLSVGKESQKFWLEKLIWGKELV